MSSTYPPLAVKAAAMSVADALPVFLSGVPNLRLALYICVMYRRMAAGLLLISGTPQVFFEHLGRSARTFLFFLEGNDDTTKATSKAEPLFDAIACNDVESARLIANRSRRTWNPDLEYEDDFLYVLFLLQRFFWDASDEELSHTLARYTAVLAGASDFRLHLCQAIFERDQARFDVAVEQYVAAEQSRFASERAAGRLDPDEAATTAHVSTELLAWLRLAGEVGFSTGRRLPMAPLVARRFDLTCLPEPDDWKIIDPPTDLL